MKLNPLASTSQATPREAGARGGPPVGERVRRVAAAESVDADRPHSLQQELAEVDPRSVGPFAGSEQVLQSARQLAAQLARLGSAAKQLLRRRAPPVPAAHVDDQA